jgi:glycine/D-amino acid oxidase-like deaminating enzyme
MEISEKPTWKEGIERPTFPKLEQDLNFDVAIVGAGLAGIFIAYKLAKSGKKVAVLEKKHVGSGATEYTTAFLTRVIDTDLSELRSIFGDDKARLVWQSHQDAIDEIEKIIREEKIDCDFTRTSLTVYANTEDQYKELAEAYETEKEMGFAAGELTNRNNLNFYNAGYYQVPNQAKFQPLKFLFALSEKVVEMNGRIFEQSEVTKIRHEKEQVILEIGEHKVSCEQVVVATYQPFHNRIRLFLKRGMYKSYVLETKLPEGLIAEGLYIDMDNPYHYFRIDSNRMILGGEDVKSIFKISKEKSFRALEEYLAKILPKVNYEITREWVGPILEPSEGLALIGETFANEFVASAFSGNGMTYSAISAMVIPDLIQGRSSVYAAVYDPKRIPNLKQLFTKGSDYVDELFGAAAKNVFKKKSPAS